MSEVIANQTAFDRPFIAPNGRVTVKSIGFGLFVTVAIFLWFRVAIPILKVWGYCIRGIRHRNPLNGFFASWKLVKGLAAMERE